MLLQLDNFVILLKMHRILTRKWFQHTTGVGVRTSPSSQRLLNVPIGKPFAIYGRTPLCSLCGNIQFAYLHSSAVCQKKKIRAPFIPRHKSSKVAIVWKNMTVQELADALSKPIDIIYEILSYVKGSSKYRKPDIRIDNTYVIQMAVKKAGFSCKIKPQPKLECKSEENIDAYRRPPPLESELFKRPPVVTIMGHVDHGKTTLLDAIRHSSIVDTEFGGITQHIGAFSVKLAGQQVTFLDTPGHAAFKAMRSRGAHVTDLIVLVVAADDGVMHQTKESIELAQEAGVPIIVAINKIDKPGSDIDHCCDMLLENGVQLEKQGGEIQAVPISALKGDNLDVLIEALVLQAELLNLRADPSGFVEAIVIESSIDLGRGKVATCIIQRGTLRRGVILVAGTAWAKVRGMFSDSGDPLKEAPPGTPVQIIGWRDLPEAGELVLEVESERRAAVVIDYRKSESNRKIQEKAEIIVQQRAEEHLKMYKAVQKERHAQGIRTPRKNTLPVMDGKDEDSSPRVAIILKGDVDGSVEAILDVIDTYNGSDCQLYVLSYGVGMVTPSDVTMAATFNGIIYSFNVETPRDVQKLATQEKVTIKKTNIIYRLIEDLQKEISLKLPTKSVEEILGEATVLEEFIITERKKKIPIAGCRCVKGELIKDGKFRVTRGQDIIHEGELESMRHHKKEVKSTLKDRECGLMFKDEEFRFQPGDIISCYIINQVEQVTDWNPGF